METRVDRYQSGKTCGELATIIMDGQEFTAMGSWVEEVNGKLQGILYADDYNRQEDRPGTIAKRETYLTNWDSSIKVFATIGSTWKSNFRDYDGFPQENRSYYFTLYGRRCRGVNYNRQWSQIVRFKEV